METSESTGGQNPDLVWVKVSLKFQTQDGTWVGFETGAWVPRIDSNTTLSNIYANLERRENTIKDSR
jgi:hypothetical protein